MLKKIRLQFDKANKQQILPLVTQGEAYENEESGDVFPTETSPRSACLWRKKYAINTKGKKRKCVETNRSHIIDQPQQKMDDAFFFS